MEERILIPVEELIEHVRVNIVDVEDFNGRVVGAYNDGTAEKGLEADDQLARSIIPAATGALRDFSYIAPDIPEFIPENCVGCMDCVTECPDTAILGKVVNKTFSIRNLSVLPTTTRERLSALNGQSRISTSPFWKRRASAAASSGSLLIPLNAKAARNAWTPAAIIML